MNQKLGKKKVKLWWTAHKTKHIKKYRGSILRSLNQKNRAVIFLKYKDLIKIVHWENGNGNSWWWWWGSWSGNVEAVVATGKRGFLGSPPSGANVRLSETAMAKTMYVGGRQHLITCISGDSIVDMIKKWFIGFVLFNNLYLFIYLSIYFTFYLQRREIGHVVSMVQ